MTRKQNLYFLVPSTTFQDQHWLYSHWWLFNRFSIPGMILLLLFRDYETIYLQCHPFFSISTTNINRIRKYLSRDATEQFFYSFITSRLDNNNALLYGLPANQLYRLQKIQNTAARILTFSRKSFHVTPILKELHWLPVTQRIVFKLPMIVYECTNNIAYLSELLSHYSPTRTLRSGNKQLLQKAKSNRSLGDRSFAIAAPRLWNELPFNVRTTKNLLKTHLMSDTFCKV